MLVADLLCGAGGSSTGAARALNRLGLEMELVCLNHWDTAIETHTRNHPKARHYCQDISAVRPHIVVPEGYLDLLMASPSCTHHSIARGGKPTSDQQRSDPWHIITWLTELRVKRIIVENVWEFTSWGAVDHRTGKPIKSRKGEYFQAWIQTIQSLGFELEWRKLNAADYGDATTRRRFILMGRSDGKRIIWPAVTHQKRELLQESLLSDLKPWRPASEIIDWSIKGQSIFSRPRPLAPKTLMRIYAGAVKFHWPEPFLHRLVAEMDRSFRYAIASAFARRNAVSRRKEREARRNSVVALIARLRAFRASPGQYAAGGKVADPLIVTLRQNVTPGSAHDPINTISAGGKHIGLAQPLVVNMKGKSTSSSTNLPLPTQTAHAPHLFSAEPIVLSQHSSGAPRSSHDPLPTITTGGAASKGRPGCARPMLAKPFVATVAHGNDARETNPDGRRSKSVEDPLGAVHGSGVPYAVVEPFVLSRHAGGAPRAVDEPTPTQVARHSHALIAPYYGSGSGDSCQSAEDPLPTATAKARFGMVVPVTHSEGGNGARSVEEPIPTLTTAKGGEFAVAMPVTHAGGESRVRDVTEPLQTVTGAHRGEIALASGKIGANLEDYDILFRMFEAHELAAAMGFNTDDQKYEFAGTKTEQIKQIGNAVSVRKMEACVGAIMSDAAPMATSATAPNEAA